MRTIKEQYAIIQIAEVVYGDHLTDDGEVPKVIQSCWKIHSRGYDTPAQAKTDISQLDYPSRYIITQYWE